ncbi:hypothetical protein niasHS_009482 [Heterodera schachtii]|uniref:RING-type domain-containing protein n=1 Tax=Heterodera schachtii TaxID=97005 RepID=A0ABD2J1X6_HETSC
MLTFNDGSSLFALFLLCFSYISSSVLVDGARDGAPKYGTESPSSSTSSRASLTDLFANDHHKTLTVIPKRNKNRQSVDKKGQKIKRDKGEKVTDKAKANLQRMLQLLGTAVDQIDGKEHLSGAAPFMVAAVVVDGVVKGSVAAVNSIRHLHNSGPIVPPAGPVPKERATIINKVTQRIVQAGEPSAECAICLGNYEPKESVDKLPCEGKHEFHTSCIQLWFKQNTTCPLCRTKISVIRAENGSTSNASNAVPVV